MNRSLDLNLIYCINLYHPLRYKKSILFDTSQSELVTIYKNPPDETKLQAKVIYVSHTILDSVFLFFD
ncbi:hypothetical protein H8356DRAFT_1321925 [Neocallimastix lanati (nom. inval.)]|nr:hypothetical protein H8356DRAFT_1321925 [Neocallimastix sp. JGI-2020a]